MREENMITDCNQEHDFSCVLVCEVDELGQSAYDALVDNGFHVKCIWTAKKSGFAIKSRLRLALSSKKSKRTNAFAEKVRHLNTKILDISARGEKCLTDALSQSNKPGFILIAGSGVIFPAAFLDKLNIPILNFHPALLPAYRGPAPLHALVLNNDADNFGGMTVHLLVPKIDAGAIIKQNKVALSDYKNITAWNTALLAQCHDLVLNGIIPYLHGELEPTQQNEELASYQSAAEVPSSITADMSFAEAEDFALKAPIIYGHTKVTFVDTKNRRRTRRILGQPQRLGPPTGRPPKWTMTKIEMDLMDARSSFQLNHRPRRYWEKIKRSLSLTRSNKH